MRDVRDQQAGGEHADAPVVNEELGHQTGIAVSTLTALPSGQGPTC